jgi:hypothetical protein
MPKRKGSWMNFMFILLCEFYVVLQDDEMNCNIYSRVFYTVF